MTNRLIPPSYLFTLSLPIYYRAKLWGKNIELEPTYQVPPFILLDRPTIGQSKLHAPSTTSPVEPKAPATPKSSKGSKGKASTDAVAAATSVASDAGSPLQAGPLDTRIAWSEEGLTLQFTLTGKTRRPYCRLNDLEHSDALEVFVDTRNTKTVHRATRYCHRFLYLPTGTGPSEKDPYGSMLKIHLARGEPPTMGAFQPQVESKIMANGYRITCHMSRKYLEGWSPSEQPEIGLYFQIRDAELGHIHFAYDRQLPVSEDPSLWPTAFLAKI
ncbi:MAG: hypothetical protein Q8M16_19060 [Pirellulaceae bacterium]|nr:hypothetical protein [Pirellulaceae bacterium]